MSACIFCKISNGEVSSATIYEDDDFCVFLDVAPASQGHTLIVTKQHYENLYEIPDELLAKAILLAKKVASAMKEALPCEGLNIVQNNGAAAGQTVFHFHIHIIPRYENDCIGLTWTPGKLTREMSCKLENSLKGTIAGDKRGIANGDIEF